MVEWDVCPTKNKVYYFPEFTIKDLCVIFDVAPPTVRYWIQQRGWLHARHTGFHGYRISWNDLEDIVGSISIPAADIIKHVVKIT